MDMRHGFTTVEEWKVFFQEYFKQVRELEDFNRFTLEKSTEEWIKGFRLKAGILEKKYHEKVKFLESNVEYFIEDEQRWSQETADALLNYLYRYCLQFEDIQIGYELSLSLKKYYERQENQVAIMKCDLIYLICLMFLDPVCSKGEILSHCETSIAVFEKYYDILTEEEKSMALSFYDIQSVLSLEYAKEPPYLSYETLEQQFQARMKMLNRFQAEADMSLQVNQIVPCFGNIWKCSYYSLPLKGYDYMIFSKEKLMKNLQEVEEMQQHIGEDQTLLMVKLGIIKHMLLHYMKEIDHETYALELKKLMEVIPYKKILSWDEFDDEYLDTLNMLLTSFVYLGDEGAVYQDSIVRVMDCLMEVYNLFPTNNYLEHVADTYIYLYFIPALRYVDQKDALKALLKLTVFRQPQTAFHSVIVGTCSQIILKEIIHSNPNLLVGVLSCESEEDVVTQESMFMDYIIYAAMLHDVGKILYTNVINVQYRKLIDIEFRTITHHPYISHCILSQIPSLRIYDDIATGHHKSCDGKYGYPKEFDNRKSDKKILIDLVKICDCLDAATDYFGRSYSRTKHLEEVLEELTDESSAFASYPIMKIINASKQTQAELKEILEEGREEKYMLVYEYMKKEWGMEEVGGNYAYDTI